MSEYARDLAMAHYKAVQEASTDPNPNPSSNPNLNSIEGMQRYERVKWTLCEGVKEKNE